MFTKMQMFLFCTLTFILRFFFYCFRFFQLGVTAQSTVPIENLVGFLCLIMLEIFPVLFYENFLYKILYKMMTKLIINKKHESCWMKVELQSSIGPN